MSSRREGAPGSRSGGNPPATGELAGLGLVAINVPCKRQARPIEFGVKNRDAQLVLLFLVQRSPLSLVARVVQSEV
ncbi:hypothetical protein E2562_007912 [Oryza meyeriana var. granulata]|uniref:Uncharacterized protein n=1 Tax=Oryza meyeriana var. granulata TaxID=110450 RepID=A0A6G1DVH7_9ORYZ|nr:hypothetical protein E2562_007912 [Oryza meyeriana var. granulata]